jgi:hypothetical protein
MNKLRAGVNRVVAIRPVALSLVVASVTTFLIQAYLNLTEYTGNYAVDGSWRMIIIALFFLQMAFSLLLSSKYQSAYWINKPKKITYDERLVAVRRKMFEISYSIAVGMVGFTVWYLVYFSPKFIDNFALVFGFMYLIYALPSFVATFLDERL